MVGNADVEMLFNVVLYDVELMVWCFVNSHKGKMGLLFLSSLT